ncbi:hypothetical protein CLF_106535 [Clonorchis sinensis]|uniref:Uncharacterized protein n=1 Tax=Clonorchis sinensis TaxID=79923 RepID=G7YFB2_CLOSI|nr:hypothetical protein CLF_106535 [Clonorchis sinensis]
MKIPSKYETHIHIHSTANNPHPHTRKYPANMKHTSTSTHAQTHTHTPTNIIRHKPNKYYAQNNLPQTDAKRGPLWSQSRCPRTLTPNGLACRLNAH